MINFAGAKPVGVALAGGNGFSFRRAGTCLADHRSHAHDHPELAAEIPPGGVDDEAGRGRHRQDYRATAISSSFPTKSTAA